MKEENIPKHIDRIRRLSDHQLIKEIKRTGYEHPATPFYFVAMETVERFEHLLKVLEKPHWTRKVYKLLRRKNKCGWNANVLKVLDAIRDRIG